jgi:ubiquinone/menaquinone biosynthesis C-methylase UbiE
LLALSERMLRAYFDRAYNPAYDLTTARINSYRTLQLKCVKKLHPSSGDRVLCIGMGTGNEVPHILQAQPDVEVVGIDQSRSALRKARRKVLESGKRMDVSIMDAHHLAFTTGSFDRILCIHVTDFVDDRRQVTSEALRVLKDGGRFVITYPAGEENAGMGLALLKGSMEEFRHPIQWLLRILTYVLAVCVYLPMLFRPNKRPISREELYALLGGFTTSDLEAEEDTVYRDFIVCGTKQDQHTEAEHEYDFRGQVLPDLEPGRAVAEILRIP